MTAIWLDVARLVERACIGALTGIDRVELAYAETLLTMAPDRLRFVMLGRWSGRLAMLPDNPVRMFLRDLRQAWADGRPADCRGSALRLMVWAAFARDAPVDPSAVYLLVSHRHLHRPTALARALRRSRAAFVPMVHDVIPLEFPEYGRPGEADRHRRRIATVAELADAVVVNSAATGAALAGYLSADQPVHVAPLGVTMPAERGASNWHLDKTSDGEDFPIRHDRAWPGHPRLWLARRRKSWVAGPSPIGISINEWVRRFMPRTWLSTLRHGRARPGHPGLCRERHRKSWVTGPSPVMTNGEDLPTKSLILMPMGPSPAMTERGNRRPDAHGAKPGPDEWANPPHQTPCREADGGHPKAFERPYFVCLGTIEPRKNHLLLLQLWRTLGACAPRLLIVGRRGWENENVLDLLDRCPALAEPIQELGAISDLHLTALLRGARALLMPSFAEGFGLPVAEALAHGTPVVCSDLPALREAGGVVPEYLDPLDAVSWRQAVLDYTDTNSPRRKAQLIRMPAWRGSTWDEHVGSVLRFLGEIGVNVRRAAGEDVGARPPNGDLAAIQCHRG